MRPAEVADSLAGVYDPELAIDIVSLGLVYAIEPLDDGIHVAITATSPACPMSDALFGMTEAVLAHDFPGTPIHLELTWTPPWDIAMADRSALEELGLIRR
jgi:metal-sulfur cluster biosynthetic enzyme